MKYTLVIFLSLLAYFSQAQTFNNGSSGYEINYLPGSANSSCLSNIGDNNGGYYFQGGNLRSSLLSSGGPLKLYSDSAVFGAGMPPAYIDFYFTQGEGGNAQCVPIRQQYESILPYFINMSGINSKVIVYAKANYPTTVDFALAYSPYQDPIGTTSYDAGVMKSMNLTTTMAAYELDFSNWSQRSRVNMYGILFRDTNVVLSIEKIVFGAQARAAYFNHVKGSLYDDMNNDCTKQTGETGISDVVVEATDGQNVYYGITDSEGNYSIGVDSGSITYAITPRFNSRNSNFISNVCVPSRLVAANGAGQDLCCTDFGLKVKYCAQLSVEVSSDRRRRCFTSNSYVSYKNHGNTDAASTVVKVVYPEYVKPISSIPDWSSKVGDTLFYDLGNLAAGASGTIALIDSVICGREDIRGLAQCTKAIISPKFQCLSNEPAWDGSSVTVAPYCENGVARFIVQNVGLEDMAGSSAYRMYSNDTLVFQSTFQLISGNTFQVRYPADGAVIRLEADQRPSHPGRSQPRAFVEGCGTAAAQTSVASESLVLSVPQDDLDEEVAISCMTIIDSYDPNDKAALPIGITDDHLVKAGTPLKYTIRFQNTGSDVAYKVVVVDTMDANLDMSTFTEIAARHPYVLKVTSEADKTVLTYTFNNINLKDSTTSEPESHGFLSFYINAKADLADGNTIHNKAEIYFDYNSAIVTNVVDHTIGTYVPTDLTKGNSVQVSTGLFNGNSSVSVQRVTLYPNPASDVLQVKLDQQLHGGQLIILDLSGHEVWSGTLKGEITAVSLSTLSSGMYLYKVMSNGEYVGVGKLLVK